MRIIGIDPGTAITGYGVIEKANGNFEFVAAGVIRTLKTETLEKRLKTIYEEINQLIDEYRPQGMAVELLYFANNVTTAMSVSHARGVVLLTAANHKLPVAEYTPLQVKQAITGYGKADKKQIQAMVQKLLKLNSLPKPDDAADALAIAICHSGSLKA